MSKYYLIVLAFIMVGCSQAKPQVSTNIKSYEGSGVAIQGRAQTIKKNLFTCDNGRSRIAGLGEKTDKNLQTWIVPSSNQYSTAVHATDLYNECSNVTPKNISEVDLNKIPVVEIDKDGEIVVGYIFADNYFELYINGKLIGVDAIPFTPFNSSVVSYKVKKPYTISVKLIDWEENLGLGSERNRGSDYHSGDGGFIASFSDGTITNEKWHAQTFYTSPIFDLKCIKETGELRDSSACFDGAVDNAEDAYSIHWKIASNWQTNKFDYSKWPLATTYTEDEIGVNNKKAYMNFREKFAGSGAKFIWSTNVVLDNQVLLKYRVK